VIFIFLGWVDKSTTHPPLKKQEQGQDNLGILFLIYQQSFSYRQSDILFLR